MRRLSFIPNLCILLAFLLGSNAGNIFTADAAAIAVAASPSSASEQGPRMIGLENPLYLPLITGQVAAQDNTFEVVPGALRTKSFDDGAVTLVAAAGGAAAPVTLYYTPETVAFSQGIKFFSITASGAWDFPLAARVKYPAGSQTDGLGLFRFQPDGSTWVQLSAQVDPSDGAMVGLVEQQGRYAMLLDAPCGATNSLGERFVCLGSSPTQNAAMQPAVRFLRTQVDPVGNAVVMVEITGGAVARAAITGGAPGKLAVPLARTPAYGADVWTAIFSDIPNNQIISFTITAEGTDGTSTSLDGSLRGWNNNHQGAECILDVCGGWAPVAGKGVLAASGSLFYRIPLINLPGPGDSDIDITLTYHSQGQEDGPVGRGWFFSYGMHMRFVDTPLLQGAEVRYPDGRLVRFASTGSGLLEPVDPDIHDRLEGSAGGYRLTRAKTLIAYLFDSTGRLTVIQDRNLNSVRLLYEGDRLVRIENDALRSVTLTYDAYGRIATITATGGKQIVLAYDGDRLVGITDANGGPWQFAYETRTTPGVIGPDGETLTLVEHLMTAWIDPNGKAQGAQVYDELGRVTEQTAAGSERRTFKYYAEGRATSVTDAYENKTTYLFDALGRLVEQIAPDATSELFYYDDDFNRTYYMDRAGRVWRWSYDAAGNMLHEEGPLGWLRTWEYNELGLPVRATERLDDATTLETLFTYNPAGNLLTITNPLGAISDYRYDERGLLTRAQDFAGRIIYYTYNNKGDLTSRSNGSETTLFQRDDAGRLTQVTLPEGQVYTYAYNNLDQLTAVGGPLGFTLTYQYDAAGNLIAEKSPTGAETRYEVNSAGRVTVVIDPLESRTEYAYGAMGELASVTDAESRKRTYEYDVMLRLVKISEPLGAVTRYGYDLAGNRATVTDAEGRVQHTRYDALDRPIAVTENYKPLDPASSDTNLTTTYTYDLGGRLLKSVDPEGNAITYTYDLLGRLTGQLSAEGQQWSFEYDAAGSLVRAVSPRGAVTEYGYDESNRLIRETDAYGQVTRYEYNRNGWQTAVINPLGAVTSTEYDALGRRVTEIRNALPGQEPSAQVNVTTRYAYDLAGNLTAVTDPRNYAAQYTYDAAGRLMEAADFAGAITRYAYDRVGNLTAITDPLGGVTRYTVDDLDRRMAIANPEDHTVRYGYNLVNELISITDANGGVTTLTRDGVGRVREQTDALGGVWQFTYNRAGRITAETDPNQNIRRYTYDRVYRPLLYTDATGAETRYGWDASSNLISLTDPNGRQTAYEYDLLERLTAFTLPSGATERYAYDPLGNRAERIDADSVTTRYDYDPLSRLIAVTQNFSSGAPATSDQNVVTRYTYDANGGLTEITNPLGAVTRFERDAMGRPIRETNPLGSTWAYAWDAAGNLISRLDANGALTEYRYYPDQMLREVQYPDETVAFAYDPNNNRTAMTDSLGESHWHYDALNRVTRVEDALGRRIKLGYDAAGNRTSLIYPNDYRVRWQYDAENRMVAMTDPAGRETSYERDAAGSITGIAYANGIDTAITYTPDVQVASITHRRGEDGKVAAGFAYTYSPAGDVTQIVNQYGWRQPAEVTEQFHYDRLHRLTGVENSEGISTSYQYDAVGNRLLWQSNDNPLTQQPGDPFQIASSYNAANLLTQAQITGAQPATLAYQYDANGNRTEQRAQSAVGPTLSMVYDYDVENRLTSVQAFQISGQGRTVKSGLTTLSYDGLGRPMVQVYNPPNGGSNTRTETLYNGLDPIAEYQPRSCRWTYLYRGAENALVAMQRFPTTSSSGLDDEAGQPESEMDSKCGIEGAGNLAFDVGEPVPSGDMASKGNTYWFLLNTRGDVVGLTKHDGQSVHNYRYDPFGGLYSDDGIFTTPHNRFTFSGKRLDENTGLVDFGARHYDPVAGVWLTQDLWRGEISDPTSLHRTLFANANPLSLRDAYGFQPEPIQMTGSEQFERLLHDPLPREFSDSGVFIQHHFYSAAGGSYAVPEYRLEGTELYFDIEPNRNLGLSTTGRLFGRYETYGIQPVVDSLLVTAVSTQQEVYRLGFVEPGITGYRDTELPALRLPAHVAIGRNGLLLAFDAFNRYSGGFSQPTDAGKQVLTEASAFRCTTDSVGVSWGCAFTNRPRMQVVGAPGETVGLACEIEGPAGRCLSGTLNGATLSAEVFTAIYDEPDMCLVRRPEPNLPYR